MSAPELSAEEWATVERFEAAPAAEESLRERVAEALFHAEDAAGDWSYFGDEFKAPYRQHADAAIAVLSGPSSDAEQAVERVLALADRHEACCGVVNIASLREAVAGD